MENKGATCHNLIKQTSPKSNKSKQNKEQKKLNRGGGVAETTLKQPKEDQW